MKPHSPHAGSLGTNRSRNISQAECRYYKHSNETGHLTLQKLVGANSVEHADKLIFITASDFTHHHLNMNILLASKLLTDVSLLLI